MTRRIFRSIFLSSLAVLLICVVNITWSLNTYFDDVLIQNLKNELILVSNGVEEHGIKYLENLDPENFHLTWIEQNGDVLYDTHTLTEGSVEDPKDKEKVLEAFANAEGKSARYTTAFTEKYIYCAAELSDGTILCASMSESTSMKLVLGWAPDFLILTSVILFVSWLLARRMTNKIMEPLNTLNLEQPFETVAYEEVEPLLTRIQQQHVEIQQYIHKLKKQAKDFAQITSGMQEGLVLLDKGGKILSINPAACQLFGTSETCVGRMFIAIDRRRDINYAIMTAMEIGHEEIRSDRDGRVIQFDISRIEAEDGTEGTVILAFDVTERAAAERRRQEFSANVSHELKTPLQGIIGSADLIENQLIEESDIPRFIGHIKAEAQRLLLMIQDIIGLSQLDENQDMPREELSLRELAEEVRQVLEPVADMKGVTIEVAGDSGMIHGVRKLIYEIIYNLCDNAVHYNVENGSVRIVIEDKATEAVMRIQDTGTGIAPEHISRIFERFYRVDKSHSKESGGTGLGLSIVKHAVKYHHGKIFVQSEVGAGTEIKVTLKKQIY